MKKDKNKVIGFGKSSLVKQGSFVNYLILAIIGFACGGYVYWFFVFNLDTSMPLIAWILAVVAIVFVLLLLVVILGAILGVFYKEK